MNNRQKYPYTISEQLSFTDEQLFAMFEASVLLESIDNEVQTSDLAEARDVIEMIRTQK